MGEPVTWEGLQEKEDEKYRLVFFLVHKAWAPNLLLHSVFPLSPFILEDWIISKETTQQYHQQLP